MSRENAIQWNSIHKQSLWISTCCCCCFSCVCLKEHTDRNYLFTSPTFFLFLSTFQVSQWDSSFWWNFFFFLWMLNNRDWVKETKRNYWRKNKTKNEPNTERRPAHRMGVISFERKKKKKRSLRVWHLARVQNHFCSVVIRLRSNFKCFRHFFSTQSTPNHNKRIEKYTLVQKL